MAAEWVRKKNDDYTFLLVIVPIFSLESVFIITCGLESQFSNLSLFLSFSSCLVNILLDKN